MSLRSSSRRALLAAIVLLGVPSPLAAARSVPVDDIIRMSRAGLRDATILKYVQGYGVCIALAPDDFVAMAEASLSQELIDGLLDLMSGCQPGAPPVVAYGGPTALLCPSSYYRGYYLGPWFFPPRFYVDRYGSFGAYHHPGLRIHHHPAAQPRAALHQEPHHDRHASFGRHHKAVFHAAAHPADVGHPTMHDGSGSGRSHPGGAGHGHSIAGGHGGHAAGHGGSHHGGSSGGGHGSH